LYFWKLVLVHEDMHSEAALYMAQALGLPMPQKWVAGHRGKRSSADASVAGVAQSSLQLPARCIRLGDATGVARFQFDNELQAHQVSLAAFEIDSRPVAWGEYLSFALATGRTLPGCVRRQGHAWQVRRFEAWQALDLNAPACYLSAADAQAWCDWAGRALPTEAQWECAARSQVDFDWGDVWEWTASTFEPYPGFEPHPYRDYSAPWFGTHRVLRGASGFTSARMVSPCYRNFFLPQRCDIPAGFRTVKPLC
jgi:EgtB-related family protein